MKWPVFSAAILSRLSDLASRVRAGIAPTGGASGPAKPVFRSRRIAGGLLSRRDQLAGEARTARRQHRPVSPIYSRARAVTHEILARGQHGRA
jgi:hypothetical protein